MSNRLSPRKEDSYSTILSPGEDAYYARLQTLTEAFPHDIRHYLDLFPVYASRRAIIRQLAHYELFKKTVDLPGHYADFGIYFGKSYFNWHKFLEVLTPTATHKKVIGFDTFAGFTGLAPEDGGTDLAVQKVPGGFSSASFLDEFLELLALHNTDAVLPVERGQVVRGDVCETLPKWLGDNPEARFCLIHLDVDLYEPHTVILDHCWDRVVPGGVVVLDEYSTRRWPGATRAWDDFATRRGLRLTLNRFPWANTPGAFIVKT